MRTDVFRRVLAGGAILTILLWVGVAWSVPTSLRHQGRLLDDSGKPMTGQVTLKFTIYDAKTGGSIIWESSEKKIDLGGSGFYSVTLGGPQNPINSKKLKGGPLWVGLKVDGNAELSPRLPIKSVPYAIRSGTSESVADGAVGTDSLKDDSVSSQKIAGLDWTKVQNKPETLSSLQCSANDFAKFDGSQWTCGTTSSPLAGQNCGTGQVVDGVDSSGNLQCKNDQDTTYSAGGGISKSGTTFSLADQTCSSGQFVDGIQNGSLQCSGTGAITEVQAGSGISGGGTSGSVTVSLADQSCSSGQAVEGISSGNVQCTSVGDITAVNAGQGLSGGGSSGSVTVDADYSSIQQRVSGSCANNQIMTGINQDGTVNCTTLGFGSSQNTTNDTCGEFTVSTVCPAGDMDGPSCSDVSVGSYCEGDGCGLPDANNCDIYDWFIKTGT